MYLFLIRHGQSEGNVAGRLQGWQDAPLTALGERQAVRVAVALRQFLTAAEVEVAAIYSSPLQRAARTADAVSQVLGLPVQTDPDLREMHFGRVEGLTEAEWKDCFPDTLAAWHQPDNMDFGWPEGETRRGFYARIEQTLGRILAAHPPEANLVLVTHGGLIASYLSWVETGSWHGWREFMVGNCSISHLTFEPGRAGAPPLACLLTFNDTGHLSDPDVAAVTGGA